MSTPTRSPPCRRARSRSAGTTPRRALVLLVLSVLPKTVGPILQGLAGIPRKVPVGVPSQGGVLPHRLGRQASADEFAERPGLEPRGVDHGVPVRAPGGLAVLEYVPRSEPSYDRRPPLHEVVRAVKTAGLGVRLRHGGVLSFEALVVGPRPYVVLKCWRHLGSVDAKLPDAELCNQ